MPSTTDREASTTIGAYRVIARLAAGGMSEIYLGTARAPASDAPLVVLKRMRPHLNDAPELRASLIDEARIMSRLDHPNVVAVHELGEDRDAHHLVMEYLRGESLSGLVRALRARRERLAPALVAFVTRELCAGLHAAHELRGDDGRSLRVVHRDVSPQNVFVTFDGDVKLLDFGIARFENSARGARPGMTDGKLAYMAPEQLHGDRVDRRADVFACGVVLHELLSGTRLFAREHDVDVVRAVLGAAIPVPSGVALPGPAIAPELDAICMRALARDPDERFGTAHALGAALGALMPALDPDDRARESLAAL
ncbi:MAG: serine/threonine protein kinase, partial [Myxococcota bacterium]|nr:serine/threonine protein kinase [Myxococcota bacterium]